MREAPPKKEGISCISAARVLQSPLAMTRGYITESVARILDEFVVCGEFRRRNREDQLVVREGLTDI